VPTMHNNKRTMRSRTMIVTLSKGSLTTRNGPRFKSRAVLYPTNVTSRA
jgi:hypothetical protein